jgi:hypothetical protein
MGRFKIIEETVNGVLYYIAIVDNDSYVRNFDIIRFNPKTNLYSAICCPTITYDEYETNIENNFYSIRLGYKRYDYYNALDPNKVRFPELDTLLIDILNEFDIMTIDRLIGKMSQKK